MSLERFNYAAADIVRRIYRKRKQLQDENTPQKTRKYIEEEVFDLVRFHDQTEAIIQQQEQEIIRLQRLLDIERKAIEVLEGAILEPDKPSPQQQALLQLLDKVKSLRHG